MNYYRMKIKELHNNFEKVSKITFQIQMGKLFFCLTYNTEKALKILFSHYMHYYIAICFFKLLSC